MPAESRRQNASWSWPVPASAPFSAGPSERVRTTRTTGSASGIGEQREQQPRRQRAGQPRDLRGHERPRDHRHVQDPRALAPQPHRQRPLARPPVGLEVAHVVDHEDRRGEQPDRHRQHQRLPLDPLDLREVRAGHRHDAEEQEHEHLAQPLVAVRPRPAGVEHARQDRRGADQQQLPARGRDQVRARQHRQPERHVGRHQHLLRRHQPARGHPHRTQPVLGVGAPAGVGVVVRQVRADLDEQRAQQRRDERQDLERPLGPRQRGAHQHRRHRRGQRARPGGHHPDPHGARALGGQMPAHGRRGNAEKSGVRFCL